LGRAIIISKMDEENVDFPGLLKNIQELFGKACQPETPVGACMVSSEGTCRIWHQYGGHPQLAGVSAGGAR